MAAKLPNAGAGYACFEEVINSFFLELNHVLTARKTGFSSVFEFVLLRFCNPKQAFDLMSASHFIVFLNLYQDKDKLDAVDDWSIIFPAWVAYTRRTAMWYYQHMLKQMAAQLYCSV